MSGFKRGKTILQGCMGLMAAIAVATSGAMLQSGCFLFPTPEPEPEPPPALAANAGADQAITVGTAAQLAGSATGGVAPYTYQWLQTSGPTLAFVPLTGQGASVSVSATTTGTAVVQLRVSDAAGTVATDTVNVTVNSATSATLTVTATATPASIAAPDVATLSASPSGGTPGYTFSWLQTSGSPVALANANAQTTVANFTLVGTYTFTVTVTDANGAFVTSAPVTVTVTSITLAFTTSVLDNLVGSTGDDTFTAESGTIQSTDTANGDAGTDTLTIVLETAAVNAAPTLTAIENISFTSVLPGPGAASAIDAANSTGITSITQIGSVATDDLTVNNLDAIPAAAITSSAADLTLAFEAAAVAAATDAITLTVSGATDGTFTADGIETFNVASAGSANQVRLAGADVETLNITGTQDLDLSGAVLPANIETIAAAALTGDLTLTTGDANVAVTGGSGDDAITLGNGNMTVVGGAGNDTFVFADGQYTADDTVNGGDGTDTISLSTGDATGVAADQTNLTSIEGVTVSTALGGNLVTEFFGTITAVNLDAGVTGDRTITVAAGTTVAFNADSAGGDDDVTIAAATNGDGTAGETLNVTLADEVDNDGTITGDLLVNGFETVAIATDGGFTQQVGGALTITSDVPGAGATETLNVTGADNLTLTGVVTADVINASTFTGDLVLTGGAAGSATITGGTGDDTLNGSGASDTITGGAGNDIIAGGAGADSLSGGDGNDDIQGGNGADAVSGGAGEDDFIVGASFGTPDIVSDFTAADDRIAIDLSEVNGQVTDLVNATPAAVAAADAADFGTFANGANLVAAATDNIFIITNTTGIDDAADVDLSGGITLGGNTANGDGVVLLYYDANSGQAVVNIVVDTDSDADNTINDSNVTINEIARVTMTAAAYTALTIDNFDFVD